MAIREVGAVCVAGRGQGMGWGVNGMGSENGDGKSKRGAVGGSRDSFVRSSGPRAPCVVWGGGCHGGMCLMMVTTNERINL